MKTLTLIECRDIDTLRALMREAGAVYQGLRGWFIGSQPIGIYYDSKTGLWFTSWEN